MGSSDIVAVIPVPITLESNMRFFANAIPLQKRGFRPKGHARTAHVHVQKSYIHKNIQNEGISLK